ncbi:uncharacterized protein [Rutidosis leptorrhynchoides]|uniref:uncharacterized protein n=1 Tax=Rutidosis leptorrhynchoides TaxID=125765 RepID=UPI003A9A16FB
MAFKKSTWHTILKAVSSLDKWNLNLPTSIVKTIVNGEDTLFWKDSWLGNFCLCEKFDRLFRLETNQNASVADRILKTKSSWSANWEWSREPTGRTEDELRQLLNCLASFAFANNPRDSWSWTMHPSGQFSSKMLTCLLNDCILQNAALPFDTMRNNFVPQKIGIFVWRTKLGRLPVRVELDKRGIDLDSVRCPTCNNDVETVEYMILSCPKVKELWNRIFRWYNG